MDKGGQMLEDLGLSKVVSDSVLVINGGKVQDNNILVELVIL